MAFYKTCPYCKSNLDPGEKCDCERKRAIADAEMQKLTRIEEKTRQIAFNFKEETGNEKETACY